MNEQIKGQLEAYLVAKKVNLSKNRKDSIIEKLTKRVETEEEIEKVIEDYVDFIVEIAKADDRARTLEAKKPQSEPTHTEVATEEPKDDTPAWAKALLEKVEQLETAKIQESLFEKFQKDERNKNIPTALLQTLAPKIAEEYETAVENINNIALEFNKKTIVDTTPPTSDGPTNTKKLTPEFQRLADNI